MLMPTLDFKITSLNTCGHRKAITCIGIKIKFFYQVECFLCMPLGLNVYPCTLSIVSSTCVISTRLKIMVVLGMLGAVARTCVFVFKCN